MTAPAVPRRFSRVPLAEVASRQVPVAVDFPSRLLGLAFLGLERAGAGLLIPRCHSIHTFGMRFAIDLVFYDREQRPFLVLPAVGPNRVVRQRDADAVLELPSATADEL